MFSSLLSGSPKPARLIAVIVLLALTTSAALAGKPINPAAVLDFDGDGKSDYVVVRSEIPTPNSFKLVWYINGSQMGMRGYQWGMDGMTLVPADYDCDGKWDIAVWTITGPEGSPAYFHIYRSSDNTYQRIQWGTTDDDPRQTQDFDGDGKADPTVVRLESGTGKLLWYTLLSMTGEVRAVQFGGPDRPIRGDFDGDGKADLAVYRTQFGEPSSTFIVQYSSDNQIHFYRFGNAETDRVIPADFDGDGKTDFAVGRVVDDQIHWYWVESSTGEARGRQFGRMVTGIYFDGVVPGDYDGDGKTDLAVFRRPDSGIQQGYFFVDRSRDGMSVTPWGRGVTENIPAGVLQIR